MILCAGNNETFSFATPIGVGLIESAMNLTRLCLFDKPSFLLFIGSAGSYGAHQLLDIVESTTAANIELGYFEKRSYTPLDNVIDGSLDSNVSRGTNKPVIVNSSNYITTDKASSKNFLRAGIGLENMEFFSVLRIAKEFEIPAAGVFVVTNYCEPNAHEQFITNHKEAKEKLTQYLLNKHKDLQL